jgi:hypothetical protein
MGTARSPPRAGEPRAAWALGRRLRAPQAGKNLHREFIPGFGRPGPPPGVQSSGRAKDGREGRSARLPARRAMPSPAGDRLGESREKGRRRRSKAGAFCLFVAPGYGSPEGETWGDGDGWTPSLDTSRPRLALANRRPSRPAQAGRESRPAATARLGRPCPWDPWERALERAWSAPRCPGPRPEQAAGGGPRG